MPQGIICPSLIRRKPPWNSHNRLPMFGPVGSCSASAGPYVDSQATVYRHNWKLGHQHRIQILGGILGHLVHDPHIDPRCIGAAVPQHIGQGVDLRVAGPCPRCRTTALDHKSLTGLCVFVTIAPTRVGRMSTEIVRCQLPQADHPLPSYWLSVGSILGRGDLGTNRLHPNRGLSRSDEFTSIGDLLAKSLRDQPSFFSCQRTI